MVGSAIVLGLAAFALFGPLLSGKDPYASDFVHGVLPDTGLPAPPSGAFVLGADRLFRDQFVRLAVGARLSLLIALSAAALANVLGAAVGILAGYYEGTDGVRLPWPFLTSLAFAFLLIVAQGHWLAPVATLVAGALVGVFAVKRKIAWLARGPQLNLDIALMRLVDVGLCFPFLLLVMAIGAALERTTAISVFVVLGLTGWLGAARIFRAKTLQVRHLEYVQASRALGQSTPWILIRHILPNLSGTFIVLSSSAVAQMILYESMLSYLGVGVAPPTPTWGHMLFQGQDIYAAAPWVVLAPAAAILAAVFGFNLLGEGLRDALDPRES
ncbi:ABC transporter permease [Pendulispora albinea]|uniref:ABC transporter permease n=2 Tax=Pendulispora albinea TaxID=2741071 RepID=A0ABZ2LQF5_9BACT